MRLAEFLVSESHDELRRAIDTVDEHIVKLLAERAAIVREVGRIKADADEPVFDIEREQAVLARVRELNPGPYTDTHLCEIFREIMSASRSLEEPVRVGYLGPPHTFSHQAAQQEFGRSTDLVPLDSFSEIFDFVNRSSSASGVVPIENSTSGTIGETLDLFATHTVHIKAEIRLQVSHNLLSCTDSGDWAVVYSHPQAIAQCRAWLQHTLPQSLLMEVTSTAEAARRASTEPKAAAIGPQSAAEAYGLEIIHRDIQDVASNQTRFYVIGNEPSARSGRDKMALMVAVNDQVGALHEVLGRLRSHSLNLSFIQSRPSRLKPGDYIFFLELLGHPDETAVKDAMAKLNEATVVTRVLGAWPFPNETPEEHSD